jgi:hypothetical protein
MRSKRFLVTLVILILGLSALLSGVNAALDRAARSPAQNSFVVYDDEGRALFAYSGDLGSCDICLKPGSNFAVPRFLHRT